MPNPPARERSIDPDVHRATYRLQLTPEFTLHDAAGVVPYLAALGVSHVYCSPILQAVAGSTHGYDVADHSRINTELGGESGFQALCTAAGEHGLLLVVDIVPNHMAVTTAGGGRQNPRWWDVLRAGPASEFAGWVDIDWSQGDDRTRGRVLVPVLGDQYETELAGGDLRLVAGDDGPELAYHDHRLPLSSESLDLLGDRDQAALDAINAEPASLHRVLEQQHYRLTFWKNAATELNYRRFFDVNTLAGLRVEDEEVFAATHELPLRWVREGIVDGLRIDHPDGLRDPAQYLTDLSAATDGCWTLVEKILEPGEQLVADWACDGTTGYDFMGVAGGVFVPTEAEQAMRTAHDEFVGTHLEYEDVVADSKRLIIRDVLAADTSRVVDWAAKVGAVDARTVDISTEQVRAAVEELLIAFPVYRTYVTVGGVASAEDTEIIETAVQQVAKGGGVAPELLDVIAAALLGRDRSDAATELRARFQQLTGPTTAKSVEDTAFYRYLPLVSLNEVGSDPGRFGVEVDEFHAYQQDIAATWPMTMLGSSTHDTKRSEDVRARISLLAEVPDRWADTASSWRRMNAHHWPSAVDADPLMEYLLYQVLVGAHPLTVERATAYFAKASREAKLRTSWLEPDEEYERALSTFITAVMGDDEFIAAVDAFCASLAVPGRMAALAGVVLKLTCPGVPDIYQGCELWTDSLVDPDNRRPVDFAERQRMLTTISAEPAAMVADLADDHIGASKLWLTHLLLSLRAQRPRSFAGPAATYRPLALSGDGAGDGLAYLRGDDVVVVVATRPVHVHAAMGGSVWAGTSLELPAGSWRNVVQGGVASGNVELSDHADRFGSTVFVKEAS